MQFDTERAIDLNGQSHDISSLRLIIGSNEQMPFYILYVEQMANGFSWLPGQIIVCASNNDMIVKAWRHREANSTNQKSWIRCEYPILGINARQHLQFFKINSPKIQNSYSSWMPAYEKSRTGMGQVWHFKNETLQQKTSRMSFSDFMQKYFSHLLEIAANSM